MGQNEQADGRKPLSGSQDLVSLTVAQPMGMPKSVAAKIAKVVSRVTTVEQKGYNSFQKYKYVKESDIVEMLRPILTDVGLVVLPNVISSQELGLRGKMHVTRVVMGFTIADPDTGESFTAHIMGDGSDVGDKGIYKAITGCTKYAYMKLFHIPSFDDPEKGKKKKEPAGDTQTRRADGITECNKLEQELIGKEIIIKEELVGQRQRYSAKSVTELNDMTTGQLETYYRALRGMAGNSVTPTSLEDLK